jgi:hypothetical protein
MRTKALILSAALVAAGVASSMAQSNVYSLNVVGYVNITVTNGYSLITLPLQSSDPTSSVNSVLTNTSQVMPFGAQVQQWNPATSKFLQPTFAGGDGNWYDPGFTFLTTNNLYPGEAFFLLIPSIAAQQANINNGNQTTPIVSNLVITCVGTVLQGTNSIYVNSGYGFYGQFEPIVGDLTTNGFPVVDNDFLYTFSNATGYSNPLVGLGTDDSGYDSGNNLTGNPGTYPVLTTVAETTRVVFHPAVGQGFVYLSRGTGATWTQNFTVQ